MAVIEIFSKRQKKLRGETPDVFQYKTLPQTFRVQVIHMLEETLGPVGDMYSPRGADDAYVSVSRTLCHEYGVFSLNEGSQGLQASLFNFFLNAETEKALDVIELGFRWIDIEVRGEDAYKYSGGTMRPDAALEELNRRFFEHGIGFQYESGELVRVDSRIVHAEVVKPVLSLLKGKIYAGANAEFLKAHEHYRHGQFKESLNECLKALESTMKAICTKRRWSFAATATAKQLLEICLTNNLIPNYLQSHFSALRSTLESGVPTVRNKVSGHGQGITPTDVSPSLASYVLHLTATNILFLVDAEEELP